MGVNGTAFVIGIAHVAPWYQKHQQGFSLGIFGLGNIGQSMSLSLIPWLASFGSWTNGFVFFGLLGLVWAVIYFEKARESPTATLRRKSSKEFSILILKSPMTWILSVYYFLTFGGFVAMSIYLPTLLKEKFFLSPEKAGMSTAGFVVLATLARPLGGYLSDRWGAQRILAFVFAGISACSLLFMTEKIGLFGLGTFGLALCVGLGNGAVFKLVPHYFPSDTGTVTGLVGAAGGLGGFFPPLVLGFSLQHYGNYLLGWTGLLLFSIACTLILWKNTALEKKEATVFLTKEEMAVS
jgi:NNP family nitrate/nitrite transporter-like MFS transporter